MNVLLLLSRLVKGLQLALLCRMNQPEVIETINILFTKIPPAYFTNGDVEMNSTSLPADIRGTVYTCHLKNDNNEGDWNTMYNYYRIAISPQEQSRALTAISATKDKTRLNR